MGRVPELASIVLMDVERERATTEGLREEALEPGKVEFREGGCCCRIRCRPEKPEPCSWSFMTADLLAGMVRYGKATVQQ